MSDQQESKPLNGWWVFAAFAAFFGVVVLVNTVFITTALRTHSGVITKDAYKKGLSYNEILEEARSQPDIKNEIRFEDGVLYWQIETASGELINNADVRAKFIRPIKDGDDFEVVLHYDRDGLYKIKPDFPVKGAWTIYLNASWDSKTFKTTQQIIVP